jgi:hypothetical protein
VSWVYWLRGHGIWPTFLCCSAHVFRLELPCSCWPPVYRIRHSLYLGWEKKDTPRWLALSGALSFFGSPSRKPSTSSSQPYSAPEMGYSHRPLPPACRISIYWGNCHGCETYHADAMTAKMRQSGAGPQHVSRASVRLVSGQFVVCLTLGCDFE